MANEMMINMTSLPSIPFDGQVFVDSQLVKWIYNTEDKVWSRVGQVETIPIATAETNGLLSAADKAFIDSLPEVGGGFGIIVRRSELLLSSPTNPDGVLVGDIELVSESLDIECADNTGTVQPGKESCGVITCDGPSNEPQQKQPGFTIKLSEKFLKNLLINVAGPAGPLGVQGIPGEEGTPGYMIDGPRGRKGEAGEDAAEACILKGFIYEDIEGIYDEALVDLKVSDECELVFTKSKISVADTDHPPDKVIAQQLIRSLVYPAQTDSCTPVTMDGWQLLKPANDDTELDLFLIRLPNKGDCSKGQPLTAIRLSDFVRDIVESFKDQLKQFEAEWLAEVKKYIEERDCAARSVLANLSQELLECERQECISTEG